MSSGFDDLLPEQTRDESDEGWGEAHEPGTGADDDRLLREVPPHHGN